MKQDSAHGYTDNELIAIFMGEKYVISQWSHRTPYLVREHDPPDCEEYCCMYDTSWKWLMPVVEKIESNPINDICIFKEATQIRVWSGDKETFVWKVVEPDGSAKIAHVFRAVVKYIKWHNDSRS